MKKWTKPEMKQLNVSETKNGGGDHSKPDLTYVSEGEWMTHDS